MPRCLLVFEPPDGGVAENVLRLAHGLPEHGWEVALAGPEEAIIYPQLPPGTPLVRLPFFRGYGHPARDAAALRGLVRLLRRERFDVVHCHSAKAGVLGRLAARATGQRVVYSPHCFPFVGPWGWPRRAFSLTVERALGRVTDALVCVAEQERRLAIAERIVPAERLHVVHNGSPDCSDHEPDPALEDYAAGGPLAACVAVLRAQKAVHVFLAAAPAILERVPDARLAVVGDGPLRDELHEQARGLGLGDRLRFFEFIPPAARQLRSLDVFVLPSAWEAFPISVLEALACGVPQVATDVGGTAEALAHGVTGLLVPPGDPAALAAAVGDLLADPARREAMAAASRDRHRERFGLERMVEATAGVYARLG